MPAKFITRESWSRCETPSMLYDAVRNPTTLHKTSLPKDTMEATQRLKQERINKLDSKGLELSHESYVTLVQVGKYMFFALMLPVYICGYGLPRWVITKVVQPLYEGLKNQAYHVGRYAVEMSKQVTDIMKGLLDQLIGNALRMSKEKGKNLFRHLFRRIRNVSEKLSKSSKAASKRLKEIKDSAAKNSKQLYKQAQGQVLAKNARMRQKIIEKAKKIGTWLLKVLKKVDEIFLTPLLKIVSLPFKLLFYIVNELKEMVLSIGKLVKIQLKKVTDPCTAFLKKVFSALYEKGKRAFNRIVQPILNRIKAAQAIVSAKYQKARQAVIYPIAKVASKIKGYASVGVHWISSQLSFLKPLVKRIGNQKKHLSKLGQRIKQATQWCASTLSPIVQAVKSWFRRKVEKTLSFISSRLQSVKGAIQNFIALPKRALQKAFASVKTIFSVFGRVVFALQVAAAIIKLAFTGGFELVQETVE